MKPSEVYLEAARILGTELVSPYPNERYLTCWAIANIPRGTAGLVTRYIFYFRPLDGNMRWWSKVGPNYYYGERLLALLLMHELAKDGERKAAEWLEKREAK